MSGQEQQLIKQCLKGDEVAFKNLYNQYVSYVYGICLRYLNLKEDAVDSVQNTFILAFKNLKRFDTNKGEFRSWLRKIAVNESLKQIKKNQRRQFLIDEMPEVKSQNQADDFQFKEHLMYLLKQMPERFRIVYNLFVIDGFDHSEISRTLSISETNSRTILNRAKSWLIEAHNKNNSLTELKQNE